MRYIIKLITPTLVLGLFLGLIAERAGAQSEECKDVGPLPTTITKPGVYCLKQNRFVPSSQTGFAILIDTSNVVLDLGGFRLRGPGGAGAQISGIYCGECSQVVVKNGTVQGFTTGIWLGSPGPGPGFGSQGIVVENIQAIRNSAIGIHVQGHGAIVRNNSVTNTIGSRFYGEAIGIVAHGTAMRVINNDVSSVTNLDKIDIGIFFRTIMVFPGPTDNLAINNRITGTDEGISYQFSNGKFRDNVTSGVAAPYIGGVDVGNNN